MKPYIKFGLIAGLVSLVINIPVSAFMGICGPGITLIAGAVAGFLSAYNDKPLNRMEGAQKGAIAGGITGGILLFGQMVAGVLALVFIQVTHIHIAFGQAPLPSDPAYVYILYYGGGLLTGLCIGIVGILLSATAGAATGAFGTRQLPSGVNHPNVEI